MIFYVIFNFFLTVSYWESPLRFLKNDNILLYMRKVVSVRLKEDVLRDVDIYTRKLGLNSRTEFIKQAIEFYIKSKS